MCLLPFVVDRVVCFVCLLLSLGAVCVRAVRACLPCACLRAVFVHACVPCSWLCECCASKCMLNGSPFPGMALPESSLLTWLTYHPEPPERAATARSTIVCSSVMLSG